MALGKNSFYKKGHGVDDLVARFEVNKGESAVFVGYLKDSGNYPPKTKKSAKSGQKSAVGDTMTVAQVAKINEYGTEKIPERSFFRSTMSEKSKEIKSRIKKLSRQLIMGNGSTKTGLGKIGEWLLIQIKNKISENIPPPNAESTIAAKGSSHTLIDTGRMRDELDWEFQSGSSAKDDQKGKK